MKIGYLLTTYPSMSETFVAREMIHLQDLGFYIAVFAASGGTARRAHEDTFKTIYRPARISKTAVRSILYLFLRYPLGTARLLALILRSIVACPGQAVTLAGNIHTIGLFAEQMDRARIHHVHACFMNWPAVIALALATATGRSFSIRAHARDVFVESGDVKCKVDRSSFVVTCNKQALAHLEQRLSPAPRRKLALNYHGVEATTGRHGCDQPKPRDHSACRQVLGIGRFVPKKGFVDLLRVFALVVERNPQYRLMLIGDGPERPRLSRLVGELSLGRCVEFLGWLDSESVLQWLRDSDVLVVPSVLAKDGDRDGIPNVILEAFVAGAQSPRCRRTDSMACEAGSLY